MAVIGVLQENHGFHSSRSVHGDPPHATSNRKNLSDYFSRFLRISISPLIAFMAYKSHINGLTIENTLSFDSVIPKEDLRSMQERCAEPVVLTERKEDGDMYLVARAQNGDREAFGTLVRAYEPIIFRFILRYVGNRDDAVESMQEVFSAAFQNLNRFNGSSLFRTWLCGIALRQALMFRRTRERYRKYIERYANQRDGKPISSMEENPAEIVMQGDSYVHLIRMLSGLSIDQKNALILSAQGMTMAEIAEMLEIGISAVKMRVHRARTLARKALFTAWNQEIMREAAFTSKQG